MKLTYKFSNLLGIPYKCGNVLFTSDGKSLLSPVGNRITLYNLVNGTSVSLPFETATNIMRICLSNDNRFLITFDVNGQGLLINMMTKVVLCHINFKKIVVDAQFSPNNEFIAISHGRKLQVWKLTTHVREFNPFQLYREYTGHYDDILCINWSHDGKYILTGSKDLTVRMWSLDPIENYHPFILGGHRSHIINVFFDQTNQKIFTVTHDGAVLEWIWEFNDDFSNEERNEIYLLSEGKWITKDRHVISIDHARITSASICYPSLLCIGFSTGIFSLYSLGDGFSLIHSLTISQNTINTIDINPTGEWIAFGSQTLSQLLVWEWKSETHILKQQGHFYDISTVAYSPDGLLIATGGDDGKVKLWNTMNGFCIVTFSEHTGPVSDLSFIGSGHALLSSSLDGTIRCYDIIRYRNFRTFVAPEPVQFSCVSCDSAGEIVAAGTADKYLIYVWSIQTSKLLDILEGVEGPISCLRFCPNSTVLAAGSWDKSLYLWDVTKAKEPRQMLEHPCDILSLDWRADGKQLVTTGLNGTIYLWDTINGELMSEIAGKRDIAGGRRTYDIQTAKNTSIGKCFTSISYSPDGECIIAGGRSKFICIYAVDSGLLLKKYQISYNRSFDGLLDYLNSKNITEAGPIDDIDDNDIDPSDSYRLPGVIRTDLSTRRTTPEIRSKCVKFSPTGDSFCAATTEGLIIYTIDDMFLFNPIDLDVNITPETIYNTIREGNVSKALIMSLCLNEKQYIVESIEKCNIGEIPLLLKSIPFDYLNRLIDIIATQIEDTPHIEFYLMWCLTIFQTYGEQIKKNIKQYMSIILALHKIIHSTETELLTIIENNVYSLNYLCEAKHELHQDEVVSINVGKPISTETNDESSDFGDQWNGPE